MIYWPRKTLSWTVELIKEFQPNWIVSVESNFYLWETWKKTRRAKKKDRGWTKARKKAKRRKIKRKRIEGLL
jgi:hypothetical protein